jgi:hypothetical protein
MNKKILIISLIVLIIIITISVLIIKYQSTEEPKTLEPVFTFTNYAFIPSLPGPNERHQFTKSGKIKSFTNDLSISTDTTSYKTGTTLVLAIFRDTTFTRIYRDSRAVHFPPNSQSPRDKTYTPTSDITVQEGDFFYIFGNQTSGTLNGTVTVNFI